MKKLLKQSLQRMGLFYPIKKFWLRFSPQTRPLVQLYAPFIKRGDVVFDIGANTGNRTEIFWALGTHVIAVEPQPSCVRILTSQFGDLPTVSIVEAGVAAHEGHGELALCDNNSVTATMSDDWQTKGRFAGQFTWTKKVSISLVTLDGLIARYGIPAFCKIDVEGFEEEVLKGLTRKVPCLSFEFTKEFVESAERSLQQLSRLGRVSCNYSPRESYAFGLETWVSAEALIVLLRESPDPTLWGDIYVKIA